MASVISDEVRDYLRLLPALLERYGWADRRTGITHRFGKELIPDLCQYLRSDSARASGTERDKNVWCFVNWLCQFITVGTTQRERTTLQALEIICSELIVELMERDAPASSEALLQGLTVLVGALAEDDLDRIAQHARAMFLEFIRVLKRSDILATQVQAQKVMLLSSLGLFADDMNEAQALENFLWRVRMRMAELAIACGKQLPLPELNEVPHPQLPLKYRNQLPND